MKMFSGSFLHDYLRDCGRNLEQEVMNEGANRLLNIDETSYIEYLIKKYLIQPLIIEWNSLTITEIERSVSAEKYSPFYRGGSGEYDVKQVITYHLPFTGLHILFQMRPSAYSTWNPDITINRTLDSISFDIVNWNDDAESIKQEAQKYIEYLKSNVANSLNEVNQYNSKLTKIATDVLARRKNELLKQADLVKSLGVPIKRSDKVPSTFTVPIQQRQIIIQKPKTSDQPYNPDPKLDDNLYVQILKVCQHLGIEMERHPSIYKDKGEEALRDLFLMQLSPHFSSVTGETFNKNGKTDILIKYEGQNIFVAECKFWRGLKHHHDAIDQILSYLTWRESKAALIYFVDNKIYNLSWML